MLAHSTVCAGLLLAAAAQVAHAAPSSYYLFPVKEIEGATELPDGQARPLIDKRVRDLLSADMQATLVQSFAAQVAQAYPSSVVHARQVRDNQRGKYQYQDNDSLDCGTGFTVKLRDAYAVVLGITRASWYEVERGGRTELLVPLTLNLQLVKPDSAKVVYAINDTVYSQFAFAGAEMGTEAMRAKVASALAANMSQQVQGLVSQLKAGFEPKTTTVRVVGRSAGVLVVDQGFEVGFRAGDEPQGANLKTGREALFKVLSVDSGYAVLKVQEGEAAPGDEFNFRFEAPADDSRKPRLLPLSSQSADKLWSQPLAELFTKEVGFKAGFQVVPVDVNFRHTMAAIDRKAACVPWDKYPAAKTVEDSRKDHPNFFLRFDLSRSTVARVSGLGDVKTSDHFITTVTAQLLDTGGHILHSEMGSDAYRLDRTGGQGLSLLNAYEVSQKNATLALARRFAERARFESGEFKVTSADKTGLVAAGLNWPEGAPAPDFEVLRPLDVKVSGKPTHWRLTLDKGSVAPVPAAGGTRLSYSLNQDQPRAGDLVRISNLPRAGQVRLPECKEAYRGPGTLVDDQLLPLIRHAAYSSNRYQVQVAGDSFADEANDLLKAGFFDFRVSKPKPEQSSTVCLRPGYLVKQEAQKCDGNTCSAQVLAATTVILEKGTERVGNFVQAERLSFDGFVESQGANFVGLRSYESVQKSLQKLTDKLNSGK